MTAPERAALAMGIARRILSIVAEVRSARGLASAVEVEMHSATAAITNVMPAECRPVAWIDDKRCEFEVFTAASDAFQLLAFGTEPDRPVRLRPSRGGGCRHPRMVYGLG